MNSVKNAWQQVSKTILSWNVKKLTVTMLSFAVVIGIAATFFWYNDVYMTNERRFWQAVDNSMSTQSVVRTLTTGGTGNQVVQDNRFFFGAQTLAESKVEFANRSATVNTEVVTEGISTPSAQYSRYVAFETNEVRPDGTTPNLDAVLVRWSGETATQEQAENARLNYISELVTLAIFGNFDADYRQSVVDALRASDVYRIDENNTSENTIDGEAVLLYPVSVGLQGYAQQLQNSFVKAGLGEFPPLDPSNYRPDARINAQFIVRKRDNTFVGIQFGDRQERYSNYGVIKDINLPVPEFTPAELESTVQQEIQG